MKFSNMVFLIKSIKKRTKPKNVKKSPQNV